MATGTVLKLGPGDHGQRITYEDFLASDAVEGFHYEIINGRVYVTLEAELPHADLEGWLFRRLDRYSTRRPEIINRVHQKSRVFVPDAEETTVPEPDIAAYQNYPLHLPLLERRWQDISPMLVAEVLSPGGLEKDLVRNVELYWRVPTIREYWILDGLPNPDEPILRVYRRRGKRWQISEVGFNAVYTTKLLPGFKLRINPHA